MKEKHFKAILKNSEIETSEEFTEKLLQKIEAKKVSQPSFAFSDFWSQLYTIAVVCIVLLLTTLFLFYGKLPKVPVLDLELNIFRTPLFVIVLFLALIGINHLLKLKHSLSNE